jgi:ABC-type sugar transport system ATPase subunit
VRALDGVSFSVMPGEVHALMGENGAGKSTLMKVLGGIYQPDEGRIFIGERETVMMGPLEAKANGVMFIHQELSLAQEMSVAENIYLGELPRKRSFGRVDWGTLYSRRRDPRKAQGRLQRAHAVGELSIANQQMVEIARALTVDAKAVIFDEPTASLTDAEKVVLFDVIEDLQGAGRRDHLHLPPDGRDLQDHRPHLGAARRPVPRHAQHRRDERGRDHADDDRPRARPQPQSRTRGLGPRRAEVEGLSCGTSIRMLRSRCARARFWASTAWSAPAGPRSPRRCSACASRLAGRIILKGEEVTISSPIDAIAKGISLVPESRKEQGLVLGMNCRDNMTLPQVDDLTAGPFVSDGAEIAIYDQYRDRLQIKAPSWRTTVGNLSGGNQQKIVIGKWLSMRPEVLIVDEPTRGIDVGSKSEIHNLMRELAKQGYAVIVISSEMPEVLHVSDRIVAMYHGRIMREFTSEEVTEDSLIQAISGICAGRRLMRIGFAGLGRMGREMARNLCGGV